MDFILLVLRVFFLTIFATGIVIVFRPNDFFQFLEKHTADPLLHLVAVFFRLILGVLLLFVAEKTKFPLVIAFVGALAITAAIILLIIGRRKFSRLMLWFLSRAKKWHPFGGLLAMAFAAFLFYALS
ncbi:hypothetical protein [Thalassomonas actiniarum]|uniref:Uncharacterized protein n=1 Tax=Thalassomonas actiniarum TaxID=485447 RepID=A0AAE9YLI2_9GAMM|nr:hypothetical protein [Thalassomonas actiniarum]WDD96584.1 hypothetical protein SG35_014450 [Thalassomonas actiniarum]